MQTLAHKFRAALLTPRNRVIAVAFAVAGTVVLGMLLARNAHAQGLTTEMGATMALVIGYGAFHLAGFFGMVLLKAVEILIWVASYQGFVTATPVVTGWIIVRDIANMFFILALLIIAFGTILGIDKYSYRNKQLSRLLIMAILVNFSRTIAGLIIDFSQVVMLTFVNGFGQAAGGNFMTAFRINELYSTSPDLASVAIGSGISEDEASVAWGASISMILALCMTVIALSTVIIITVVLLWRVVMLWLLVIMSPLAFFLGGVPGDFAGGYYSQWWKDFKSQVVVGPFMAFFLWLALVSVASGNLMGSEPTGFGESIGPTFSAAFNSKSIGGFAVAIALMLGGVKMAQSMSSAVGAGKALTGKMTGAAKAVGKWGVGQVDKRSGFQAYRQQQAARKEAKDKETYGRRGAAIDAGLASTAAWTKGKAGAALTFGGRLQSTGQRLSKLGDEERALRQKGDAGSIQKADAIKAQRTQLQEAYNKKGMIGKGLDIAKGATVGLAGGAVLADAAAESRIVSDRQRDIVKRESEKVAKKGKPEVAKLAIGADTPEGIAAGGLTAVNSAERMGAIAQAMKDGSPEMYEHVETARQFMVEQNADPETMKEFDENTKKFFFTKAKFDDDPAKDKAKRQDYVNKKMVVDGDTPPALLRDAVPLMMQSPKRQQFEAAMLDPKQKAAYKDGIKAKLPTATGKDRAAYARALAENTSTADEHAAEYRENMLAAYGMENGSFTGTPEAQAENRKNFKEALAATGGEKLILGLQADQFRNADGSASDMAKAVVEVFAKNRTTVSRAAQKADASDALPSNVATMNAIVEVVMETGDKQTKEVVQKGRAYDNFRSGHAQVEVDTTELEEEVKRTKEAAEKAEAEAKKAKDDEIRGSKYINE